MGWEGNEQESSGDAVTCHARFIRDDANEGITTFADKTINSTLAGFKSNQNSVSNSPIRDTYPECRTLFRTGSNYAFSLLNSSEAIPDTVTPTSTVFRQAIAKASFEFQSLVILNTISTTSVHVEAWIAGGEGHAHSSTGSSQVNITLLDRQNIGVFDPETPTSYIFSVTDSSKTAIRTSTNGAAFDEGRPAYPHSGVNDPKAIMRANSGDGDQYDLYRSDGTKVAGASATDFNLVIEQTHNQGRFTQDYYHFSQLWKLWKLTNDGQDKTEILDGTGRDFGVGLNGWDFRNLS
jgi:hypothetical protein